MSVRLVVGRLRFNSLVESDKGLKLQQKSWFSQCPALRSALNGQSGDNAGKYACCALNKLSKVYL